MSEEGSGFKKSHFKLHEVETRVVKRRFAVTLQGVPRSGLDEGGQDGEDSVHHEDQPAFQRREPRASCSDPIRTHTYTLIHTTV